MQTRKLIIFLFFTFLNGCGFQGSHSYRSCEDLLSVANSEKFQNRAIKWIETNIVGKKFTHEEAWFGGGMMPGSYWLQKDFDWAAIGFPNTSQARIIGSLDNIKAISFQERSRLGIIVQLNDSGDFGVDGLGIKESDLTIVNPRIAVYCREDVD